MSRGVVSVQVNDLLEIRRLAEFPEHVDRVTHWLCREWPDPTVAFIARRLRVFDPPGCPPTLLALVQGAPVGVLGFFRFRREGDRHPSLFIDALYVEPAARRRGVATALLERAVTSARTLEPELFVYTSIPDWYARR